MFSKKEFAIVSYLRFIKRTNFILSWVEHKIKFYNLGAKSFIHCLTVFIYMPKIRIRHDTTNFDSLEVRRKLEFAIQHALYGLCWCFGNQYNVERVTWIFILTTNLTNWICIRTKWYKPFFSKEKSQCCLLYLGMSIWWLIHHYVHELRLFIFSVLYIWQ